MDPEESTGPALPGYDLGRVLALRDALCERVAPWAGSEPSGPALAALRGAVGDLLRAREDAPHLIETCRALPPGPLSEEALFAFCWRLAGNLGRFRAGRAVTPWAGQEADEWVPVEVAHVEPRPARPGAAGGRPGYLAWLRALAGTPCPKLVAQRWTGRQAAAVAARVGFSRRRRGPYPFSDPRQLVGLRFYALASAEQSGDQPAYVEARASGRLLEGNRALLRMRLRREPPCPMGYAHECHRCAVGYDRCPAAVHPLTYEARDCRACGRPGVLHDPAARRDVCLDCAAGRRPAGGTTTPDDGAEPTDDRPDELDPAG